jgi:hypothetical protein
MTPRPPALAQTWTLVPSELILAEHLQLGDMIYPQPHSSEHILVGIETGAYGDPRLLRFRLVQLLAPCAQEDLVVARDYILMRRAPEPVFDEEDSEEEPSPHLSVVPPEHST